MPITNPYISTSSDPALAKYAAELATVSANAQVVIIDVTENINKVYYNTTNNVTTNNPGGTASQVQFNTGSSFGGDSGFTYNSITDSLTVSGNLIVGAAITGASMSVTGTTNLGAIGNVTITGGTAGQLLSTNGSGVLSWANDANSAYGNSQVANYLPTYTGNLAGGNAALGNAATANFFIGSGANLTSLPGANVSGTVANATYAVSSGTAGTVTTNAQPNITSVGTLSALAVTGNANVGNLVFSSTQIQSSAYAGGQGHMMMIDTNRTDTYVEVGSADKPFKTFAAAITAVAAQNPTGALPYTFVLMGCTVTETVDFTPYNFNFITISTTCRSTFNNPVTFGNSALLQLTIRNVEFGNTVTILGDGTLNQFNNTSIFNVSFVGALTVTAVNAIAFYEGAFFAPVEFNNVNYCYVNGGQFNDDWTIRVDDTGAYPIPSGTSNPGVVLALDFIANDINFIKGGTGFGVFQPHSSRMGRTGQAYALPAGWILTSYSSSFLGNWTNNGTWTMRNSTTVVDIAGTLPSYSGTIGGSTVHMEPVAYANLVAAAGSRAFINNGNLVASGNFGAQVIGGGSNVVPAWSNGTNWYIG